MKFRDWLEKQSQDVKNTVYSFTETEGEIYTLTRWLRARKYDYNDTTKMVIEATACREEARKADYYPDPYEALGVDPSVYISQYPQLYTGFSKDGCPVFYSKPGVLNIDGVECITTLSGILNYHWHVMQHDYCKRLLQFKKENPSFKRFECVSVLDLANLTMGQLGSRTLDIIKKQAFIDSLCFPETMNKMVIVNAPRFFSATWSIIKGFVDVRTASKVELFSSLTAAGKKLREIIDENDLPSDYGGKAESTKVLLAKEACLHDEKMVSLKTEVMYVRSSQSFKFALKEDEEADIFVHTRATDGATFKVVDGGTKADLAPPQKVRHTGGVGDNVSPTKVHMTAAGRIGSGKREVKVKAESLRTRMSSEAFLVVVSVYKK